MAINNPLVHLEAASTIAVIMSSHEPLLYLNGDLTVIAASASFCSTFQIDPATIPGRKLAELGAGEWDIPRLTSLLHATASGLAEVESYELDLKPGGSGDVRHLVLNAHKLDDGERKRVRVLLSLADVTDARAERKLKDDLVREKAILLQEVQHRVANSLQIIASVLLQSARRVQSEEARGYLQDAHHRVMSIAALQQQLATSSLGEVALRAYFVQLCESLGASMISDHDRLSIKATVDESGVAAAVSVSLGLIVTELVINALKHAFPGRRHGKISVEYRSDGSGWTLLVKDDGVGMPVGVDAPKAGLGTGIVEALSKQLQAEIRVESADSGTTVSLIHAPTIAGQIQARNLLPSYS